MRYPKEVRRVIADRLRKADKSNPLSIVECIQPEGPFTGEEMMKMFDVLADLIEPEPEELPCSVLSVRYNDDLGTYCVELICGHDLETRDRPERCVNFCPTCGGRVMWK